VYNVVKKNKKMKNQNDEFVQTQENVLTQEEQIFKNLVEQNSSLYKAPSGEIYQVYLEEAGTSSHSYQEIHSNYGKNNKYDADVDYQRLKDQHPLETKKKILNDILMGERVGRIVVYKKPGTRENFEVVDGKQRIEIMRDFVLSKLKLNGKYAASFWARYYSYLLEFPSQDSVKCNSLKKQLAQNKSIPDVKFGILPSRLQDSIMGTPFDIAKITDVKFRNIKTDKPIQLGHPDYNEEIAKNQITKKFGKLNSQVAQAKPEDTVYGQTNDIVILSRKFVQTQHPLLTALNIDVENSLIESKEQREFAFSIIKCLSMFEKNKNGNYFVDWAPKTKTIQDLIIDNKIDELNVDNERFMDFMTMTLRKTLSQKFVVNGEDKFIKVPEELIGGGKKISHLILLCSLRVLFGKITSDNKLMGKYFSEGGPNNTFFRFTQRLFDYLSLLSTASKKDLNSFINGEESPVMKYGLQEDYFDSVNYQIIQDVVMLNKNNGTLGKDFREKISKLINLLDTKF